MGAFLFFLIYLAVVVFVLIIIWRAMRAHESIADSMNVIATQMRKKKDDIQSEP